MQMHQVFFGKRKERLQKQYGGCNDRSQDNCYEQSVFDLFIMK